MKDLGSPITAVATQRMPEASYGFPELCPVELEETEVRKVYENHPVAIGCTAIQAMEKWVLPAERGVGSIPTTKLWIWLERTESF